MEFIGYFFFRAVVLVFSIIPWSVIYLFSPLLAGFMHHILRYRRGVVQANLQRVFPEYAPSNIRKIMGNYYQSLAEIFLETIKGISISADEMKKRFTGDVSVYDHFYQQGKDVIMLTAHMGNWEWAALWLAKLLPHHCVGIYKPLTNKRIDQYLLKQRSKYNIELLTVKMSSKIWSSKVGRPRCIILVADQSPNNMDKAIWVDFFGEQIPFVHGPDDIGRLYDVPVIYSLITRVKRGHYVLKSHLLADQNKGRERGEITQLYAKQLEEDLRVLPEHWLWSHRRYKKLPDRKVN